MVSTTSFKSSSMQNDVHFVKFCFYLNDERDDKAGYDFRAINLVIGQMHA